MKLVILRLSLANTSTVLADPTVHDNTRGHPSVDRPGRAILGNRQGGLGRFVDFLGEPGAFLTENHDTRCGNSKGLIGNETGNRVNASYGRGSVCGPGQKAL